MSIRPRRMVFAKVGFLLQVATALALLCWIMTAGVVGAVDSSADDSASRSDSDSASESIRSSARRGPVEVEVEVSPKAPRLGDVIRLVLETRAEAGVEVLMPEFAEALGRFEIVDFAPEQDQAPDGSMIARHAYRLQPGRSGDLSIPPLRVEFIDRRAGVPAAPDGEDAYEILTERIALTVAPILEEGEALELRPAHADLGARRGDGWPVWAIALGALVLLALAAPFAYRAWLAASAQRRKRSAYDVARSELDGLLVNGLPDAGGMDAFYVKLSLIVRTYLEDRFGLRSPELTTEEFFREMGRSPDLARSHQQLLRDFLEQADLVKFAGLRPDPEAVSESVSSAERFLEETRDQVRSETLTDGVERDERGAENA